MGSEWEYTTLGECADWYSGGTPRKSCPDYWDGDIPWISAKSLKDFHVRDSEDCVTNEGLENGTRLVPTDAILFVVRGMSLKSEFRLGVAQRPVSFNQDIKAIVAKDDYLPYFLAYILKAKTAEILDLVEEAGHGTGVLPTDVIKNIEIPAINKAEQKSLVEIFKAIDDKIELNRKMNATLEAMAQALFKSWFVDFDPVIDKALATGNPIPEELAPRAEIRRKVLAENSTLTPHHSLFPSSFTYTDELGCIPEGWETATLGDYLEIKRGGSPRPIHDFLRPEGLPWVKIADATSSSSRFLFQTKEFIKPEGLKKTVLMKKGSLILSNSATPGLPMILQLDACIHDGWLHFPKINHFSQLYLYQLFLVIREELVGRGNGSVFTNLKTDILRAQNIVVPPAALLKAFEEWMNPTFERLLAINVEIQTLTKLRDTLLPKLISGELRIPEAEQLAEEALA